MFGTISCTPMVLWMIRNMAAAESATNRSIAFHPISITHMKQGVNALASWLLHAGMRATPAIVRGVAGLLVGVGLVLTSATALLRLMGRRLACSGGENANARAARALCLMFVAAYGSLLLLSITFVDAHVLLSSRILSPVYIAFLILGTAEWGPLVSRQVSYQRNRRPTTMVCIAALCALSLVCTGVWTARKHGAGSGYAAPSWYESPIVHEAKMLDTFVPVFTNRPDALYILADRPAYKIPAQHHPNTDQANEEWASDLARMRVQMEEKNGVLVYLSRITWRWHLPSVEQLQEPLGLEPVTMVADGAIYRLRH